MKYRLMAPLLSLSLGVFTFGGVVLAQEVTPNTTGLITSADGNDVSSGPGSAANGDGQTVIYGDITTGPGYTVIGEPPSTTVSAPPPAPVNPAPAPVDQGTAPVDQGTAPVDQGAAPVNTAPSAENAPVPVAGDADGDNLPDASEAQHGTDQYNADTDGDGVADGDEVNIYFTSPTNADTDGDALTDGNELFWTNSDPLLWDTDGDGWGDGDEVNTQGTDPTNASSFPGSGNVAGTTAPAEAAPSTYQGDTAPVPQSEIVTAPVDTVSSNVSPNTTTAAPGQTTSLGNGYVTAAPGMVESPTVSNGPAAAPTSAPAATSVGCSSYGTWYDAQVAYEAAGGTSSSLADSLDPDRNGVACEAMQV
jgi:hypothetical protein